MMRKYIPFILFFCLTISFFACSEKDDNLSERLVGAWQLTSININNQQQDLSGKNEMILFTETFVFKRYLSDEDKYRIGGWNIKADMLNISLDLPSAYYIEVLNSTELSLKRLDFETDGSLKTTIINYQKVSEDLLP